MATISLCLIVKNEETVLARCLESVQGLFDETIIVDTGSIDSTQKIAARYTSKLYSFPWNSDFAAARNFSFSKATQEYIFGWMLTMCSKSHIWQTSFHGKKKTFKTLI